MIQELFPPYAEVCTECEEREDETVLGFSVAIWSHGNEIVVLDPVEMVKVKEKMKARSFFVYPGIPIRPNYIRIYIYVVIYHEQV